MTTGFFHISPFALRKSSVWPDALYPEVKPRFPEAVILRHIEDILFLVPLRSTPSVPLPSQIPKLSWCFAGWTQLEIAIRNLALLIDELFDQYDTLSMPDTELIFDEKIRNMKLMVLLRDYMIQLYWILHALSSS